MTLELRDKIINEEFKMLYKNFVVISIDKTRVVLPLSNKGTMPKL